MKVLLLILLVLPSGDTKVVYTQEQETYAYCERNRENLSRTMGGKYIVLCNVKATEPIEVEVPEVRD